MVLSTSRTTSRPPITLAALRPLALMLMAIGVTFTVADPDSWGHVRFGLDFVESGRVVTATDRYSFTADRPFIYHEWLGGTVMALAYQAAGAAGLQLLKATLGAVLFAMVWAELRRAPFAWRWGGLAVAAAGMLSTLATVRPQIWSVLGAVVVTRALMSQSRRVLLALPLVFALWANLHGGWIVGGAVVAIFTLVAFIQRESRRWFLLLVGAASLLATLATPYFVTLWTFLAETVRFGRSDITEWQPMWRAGWDSIVLWAVTVAVILATNRRRRLPLATWLVLAFLGLAAARVDRISALFMVTAVTMLGREWRGNAGPAASDSARAIMDGLAVAAAIVALTTIRGPINCVALQASFAPDTVAGEALRGTSGRLVSFFTWGEYALWHFGPALQVSIDGRREATYREATLREQAAIVEGTPGGLMALERLRPDYVWLPTSSPTRSWLESHGYRLDVLSDRSFVATRSDHPPLRAWNGSSSGCFPGP